MTRTSALQLRRCPPGGMSRPNRELATGNREARGMGWARTRPHPCTPRALIGDRLGTRLRQSNSRSAPRLSSTGRSAPL